MENTDGKGRRKSMVQEAELEVKCREQECRHEIQMQSMMFNYLQQPVSMHIIAAYICTLFYCAVHCGINTKQVNHENH